MLYLSCVLLNVPNLLVRGIRELAPLYFGGGGSFYYVAFKKFISKDEKLEYNVVLTIGGPKINEGSKYKIAVFDSPSRHSVITATATWTEYDTD